MESTWFKIQAKAPPGATKDRFRIMEQNLLADRFRLSAHFEKREVAAYEMLAMKGGPKFLSAAKQASSTEIRGLTVGFGQGGTAVLMGDAVPMDQLSSFLSFFLDLPVIDATGLAGSYGFQLSFGARLVALGRRPAPIDALRDQLGLILERTKTVMDVLVIDHVEKKPTPQ